MHELADLNKYVIRNNVIGMQYECYEHIAYYVFFIIPQLDLFDV